MATPQIILNYAAFLEEHSYFEVRWGGAGRSGEWRSGVGRSVFSDDLTNQPTKQTSKQPTSTFPFLF